jgi:hypothetical protein
MQNTYFPSPYTYGQEIAILLPTIILSGKNSTQCHETKAEVSRLEVKLVE